MKSLAVVAAIIENNRGEILLAQRPLGKTMAGLWEFPGGKIEAQETAEQALHRELKEELELDVSIKNHLGIFEHRYEWAQVELHVFVVQAQSEPKTTADVQNYRWTNVSNIQLEELTPADVRPFQIYSQASRP